MRTEETKCVAGVPKERAWGPFWDSDMVWWAWPKNGFHGRRSHLQSDCHSFPSVTQCWSWCCGWANQTSIWFGSLVKEKPYVAPITSFKHHARDSSTHTQTCLCWFCVWKSVTSWGFKENSVGGGSRLTTWLILVIYISKCNPLPPKKTSSPSHIPHYKYMHISFVHEAKRLHSQSFTDASERT